MYKLYPPVREISYQKEKFIIKPELSFQLDEKYENILKNIKAAFKFKEKKESADIEIKKEPSLASEGYCINIEAAKIIIKYQNESALFYALKTLKQIFLQSKETLECARIKDYPEFKVRGFMLDISRNKVASLKTIYSIIDLMSNIKMNHFELYVEGFSFGYPSFKEYLLEDGFISVEEYQDIEKFCQERYIDLVPNQNGFGHMADWLSKEEFKDLAVCPDGMVMWGRHRNPSTLDPRNKNSIELVKKLYKDMLPLSGSKYFNMNFDEPFELGNGLSKEVCEKEGRGNVYIDYALLAYEEIKKYGKIPLIWSDVLNEHVDLLHRLPKDMIFIDWGYDATYPFSKTLKNLADNNVKFIAAPGTTSWSSFLGRSSDWLENINNACHAVKNYKGEGILLTDWGDYGHIQFWPISYLPLIYSGFASWNFKEGLLWPAKDYANEVVFKDNKKLMADILFDLGNYYRYYSYHSNGTQTFYNFLWLTCSLNEEKPIEYYLSKSKWAFLDYDKRNLVLNFLNEKLNELKFTDLTCEDGAIVIDEIKQSIALVSMIVEIDALFDDTLSFAKKKTVAKNLLSQEESFIKEQKRLWLYRNKSGGLKESLKHFANFFKFIEIVLKSLENEEKK